MFTTLQVQTQLATSKAQEAHTFAADALSRRCLCRRMLLQLKLAAQASLLTRQMKQLAEEHRKKNVLKGALRRWHRCVQLSKGLQAQKMKFKQRAMQTAVQGWRQGIELQRWEACARVEFCSCLFLLILMAKYFGTVPDESSRLGSTFELHLHRRDSLKDLDLSSI